VATRNDTNECGCAEVGVQLLWADATEAACCSGAMDDSRTCIMRECTHSGEKLESGHVCCAGTMLDSGECGCVHTREGLNPNYLSQESDCCSGKFEDLAPRCDIIEENKEMPAGASASDCVTENVVEDKGKLYCKRK